MRKSVSKKFKWSGQILAFEEDVVHVARRIFRFRQGARAWTHEAGGSRFMLVISINTLYGGHSKQAAMVAAHCHAGAYNNRWTIVVDDDIDPTNFSDVVWAMCTRCDPRDQVDIIHGGWSSALDPMCYDTETDRRNSRVIIDACIPFRRKKTFPVIARSSKALDDRIREKWAKDLPKGF